MVLRRAAIVLAFCTPLLTLGAARLGATASTTVTTIHVPGDQTSIQAAINVAGDGDTVLVAPGTYQENLDFAGKAITVRSVQGAAATVIDGHHSGPVVSFIRGETSSAVLQGFTVTNGFATWGGGGIIVDGSSPTITDNVIEGNSASGWGGGMAIVRYGTPMVAGNLLRNNSVTDGPGGAMWIEGAGSATIVDNLFVGNQAAGRYGGGGAIAIMLGQPDQAAGPVFVNNTIAANTPSGVYLRSNGVHTPMVPFVGNIVVAPPGYPAVECDWSTPPAQSGFRYNDAFDEGPPAYQGCNPGTNHNLSLDPRFVDAGHGDYHLAATSPGVDAGDSTAPGLPATDLDGRPRVQGATVDMGAYESAGTSLFTPRGPITIHVPGEAPTIQAGITAALDGDTVLVAPGTYREQLDFGGKLITVASAQGAQTTIVDGGGVAPVAIFHTGEQPAAVLRGFTLQHGAAPTGGPGVGGGIRITGSSPTITGNVITQNTACSQGSGVYVADGYPVIQGNTISHNSTSCFKGLGGGGALAVSAGGSPQIIGNVITGNSWKDGVSGMLVHTPGPVLLQGNVITGNRASGAAGGPALRVTIDPLYTTAGSAMVENLVTANLTTGATGGAEVSVFQGTASLLLTNNTVAGNQAAGLTLENGAQGHLEVDGNLVDGSGTGQQAIVCHLGDPSSTIVLHDDDSFGGTSPGFVGCPAQPVANGNLSADPHFVDAHHGNYHLAASSPAIDAGDPSAPLLPATDLDGAPRVQGRAVDIGAYESGGPVHSGAVVSLTAVWSKTGIVVNWAAPAGGAPVTAYQVTLSPTGTTRTVKSKTTSAKFSHLDRATTYTVMVVAVNGADAGPPSTVTVPGTG
jgi:hypothetical protein